METTAHELAESAADSFNKPLLTRSESADFLTEKGFPTTKGSLQKLASVGGGPEYQIFGNKSLYRPPALLKWAEERLSAPKFSASQTSAA